MWKAISYKQLTRLKAIKNLLTVHEASGITRIECSKAVQPIHKFKGPVLDYRCNQVCGDCRQHLRKGKVPQHALANGLWLGAVPPVVVSDINVFNLSIFLHILGKRDCACIVIV